MGARFTTRLSTKGQVILPKAARARKGWAAGDALVVEERPDGLLIRKDRASPPKTIAEVAGSLKYTGPAVSIEEMNTGVLEIAKLTFDRD